VFEHCHRVVDCASTVATSQMVPHLFEVVLKFVGTVGALAEVEYLWNDILLPVVQKF